MAGRDFSRKLVDKEGNQYAITIPPDVNPDSVQDILVAIHDGIVKLMGYQLVGDVFRLPDNVESPDGGKAFVFYKKIRVYDEQPDLDPEDFGEALKELLDQARNYKINRAEIKTFEGKEVHKDARGYYLRHGYDCVGEGCDRKVWGVQRLSMRDGAISRAQVFIPEDKGAARARPGSKSWLCSHCAPKSIPIPEEFQVKVTEQLELPKIDSEPIEVVEKVVGRGKPDDDLRELLKLSDWKSEVPLEFFKGYVYGVLKNRLK